MWWRGEMFRRNLRWTGILTRIYYTKPILYRLALICRIEPLLAVEMNLLWNWWTQQCQIIIIHIVIRLRIINILRVHIIIRIMIQRMTLIWSNPELAWITVMICERTKLERREKLDLQVILSFSVWTGFVTRLIKHQRYKVPKWLLINRLKLQFQALTMLPLANYILSIYALIIFSNVFDLIN